MCDCQDGTRPDSVPGMTDIEDVIADVATSGDSWGAKAVDAWRTAYGRPTTIRVLAPGTAAADGVQLAEISTGEGDKYDLLLSVTEAGRGKVRAKRI